MVIINITMFDCRRLIFVSSLILLFSTLSPSCLFAQQSDPIIVDHRHTDITKIPAYWLERAKQLTVHYGHTSHGSQIITGLQTLESKNSLYNVSVNQNQQHPALNDQENPPALRIFDGNPPDPEGSYISASDYWSSDGGITRTKNTVGTGLFDYSMWSWCQEQSSNGSNTVQQYLDTLNNLDNEFPSTRFIYMTGRTDGGSAKLVANNQMVRDYVTAYNKILFDFADIESWDPAGNYYPNSIDTCTWCADWCRNHPTDTGCSGNIGGCSHSHPYVCYLKGKAFWWLMARLAGWDGVTSGGDGNPVPSSTPRPTNTLVPTNPAPTATPTPDFDGYDCNECPANFSCYTNGSVYRWFAPGYTMTGFTSTSDNNCPYSQLPQFLGKLHGDANCDGTVDIYDRSIWTEEYVGDRGRGTIRTSWHSDFNCDGTVDIYDRSLWTDNYLLFYHP